MEAPRLLSDNPSALPVGTRLAEYELLSLLGVGGFGIVYLAFDHALEREVAIKEYMPAQLAGRTETMHVSLRSQSDAETFALGLRSFVNEARLLARFDHPSLLKVHRFWEANGTAYMAMPVMRGRTIKELRLEMAGPPDEAWLRAKLEPLLGAIEKLHSEGVYHRDIAPDNIQVEPDGHPVLLDFGAARRVISDKSQTLTAILKPAYAPIEQYAEAGSVKQGPWTDLYALGATLHFLLLTHPPPPATTRAIHDEPSALTTEALPNCSEVFLHTIDWMLAPRPSDRPQSVAQLREVLEGRALPPQRRDAAPAPWERTSVLPPSQPQTVELPLDLGLEDQATVVMPRPRPPQPAQGSGSVVRPPAEPAAVPAPSAPEPIASADSFAAPPVAAALAPAPAPARRSKLLPVGLGLATVLVGAAVALWPRQPDAPAAAAPAASAPEQLASAAPAMPAPAASALPESTVTTVVLPGAGKPSMATSPATAAPAPLPAPKPPAGLERPANRPGNGVAAASAAGPAVTVAPVVSEAPRPVQSAPVPAPAPITQAAAPAPASAPAEPPKPSAAPAGPEANCAGRNALSYFVCMERECLRSEFTQHGDCLKWRKGARREAGAS
jgi:serine/threonine protein kinase